MDELLKDLEELELNHDASIDYWDAIGEVMTASTHYYQSAIVYRTIRIVKQCNESDQPIIL